MKYVALLSGGKDSCYNLLHCQENGHELVAAASLRPEQGKDEIDSYMFQTVGQDAIELVAQALEVPLYRIVIRGTAVNTGSEYGGRQAAKAGGVQGDETEDLYELLLSVKTEHPDVQGVSVGAILSNYQRVRVEHVCRRLSLTPLCYLWQRDQRELLSEMIQAGLEAILIKVAGMGLNAKHLGKTLGQIQPTLLKLNDLYDLHPCGEGGEYETLTLDCPLFKSRIHLEEVETVIHSDNDFASVAYLRVKNATLVPKDQPRNMELSIPPLLEAAFLNVRDAVEQATQSPVLRRSSSTMNHTVQSSINVQKCGPWVSVTNIQYHPVKNDTTVEDEVSECFRLLEERLQQCSLDFSHVANINIFLSSMDLFAQVNAIYGTFFGSSPPARACVAIDLPPPNRVKLDVIAFAEESPRDRQALHVQGLSYWAPANIGPYSQAVMIKDQNIFISGQIGLIPSSLTLPSPQSLATETALSCQHVERVTRALRDQAGRTWEGHTQLALYWFSNAENIPRVREATNLLQDVCSPTLFLAVPALPKGALVEKQVLVHTGRFSIPDEDGDLEVQSLRPCINAGGVSDEDWSLHWEISKFNAEDSTTVSIFASRGNLAQTSLLEFESKVESISARGILSVRLFYMPSESPPTLPPFLTKDDLPITHIPCQHISTRSSDDWDYALCILS
ncbi:hypothetical protein K474DRAFT_1130183 [Panus rudis PR-1116 ss-1]|nr:hypothetical protein K474DRAFT_1130183 [Panus rudis PR-1116 ss-1]